MKKIIILSSLYLNLFEQVSNHGETSRVFSSRTLIIYVVWGINTYLSQTT